MQELTIEQIKHINYLVKQYYTLPKYKDLKAKANKVIEWCNKNNLPAINYLEFNYDELIASGKFKLKV